MVQTPFGVRLIGRGKQSCYGVIAAAGPPGNNHEVAERLTKLNYRQKVDRTRYNILEEKKQGSRLRPNDICDRVGIALLRQAQIRLYQTRISDICAPSLLQSDVTESMKTKIYRSDIALLVRNNRIEQQPPRYC